MTETAQPKWTPRELVAEWRKEAAEWHRVANFYDDRDGHDAADHQDGLAAQLEAALNATEPVLTRGSDGELYEHRVKGSASSVATVIVGHTGVGHASSIRREDCPTCTPQPEYPAPAECPTCIGDGLVECPTCGPHAPTPPARSDQDSTILNVESVEGLLARKDNLCPPDDVEMHERSPYKPFVDLIREFAVALRLEREERQRVEEAYNERDAAFRADLATVTAERDGFHDLFDQTADIVLDQYERSERAEDRLHKVRAKVKASTEREGRLREALNESARGRHDLHEEDAASVSTFEDCTTSACADALSALLATQRTKP